MKINIEVESRKKQICKQPNIHNKFRRKISKVNSRQLFFFYKGLFKIVVGAPKPKFVCGTDGNTYSHIQYIRVARCEHLRLNKKHDGPCKK